jgi:hypothetical protein
MAGIERAVPRQGISALAAPEINASHRPMASIVLFETFRPFDAPQIRKSLSLPTFVSVSRHDDRVRPRYLSFTTRAFIKSSISEPNPAATMRVARSWFSRLTQINQQSILIVRGVCICTAACHRSFSLLPICHGPEGYGVRKISSLLFD